MVQRFRTRVHARHERTARRLAHVHRLFQASLGILASQHPVLVDACGGTVRWSPLRRAGGGLAFAGERAAWSVVPTLDGAWSPTAAPARVVRAVDDVLDAMFRTAGDALASARPGREGNQVARGFYYMQKGFTESEFVAQYFALARAPPPAPDALTDLFGPLRG